MLMRTLFAFLADQSGASAIEYAIIAAGVATAIAAAVGFTGAEVQNKYTLVLNKVSGD
jgi:pilus assembly protein Flp/PilA